MGLFDNFSLKFLLIPLTTPKSKRSLGHSQVNISSVNRTLLACIKTLRSFPCLWCVISKDAIATLGTKSDMWKRESDKALHINNHPCRHNIELAQKWIYVDGKPLTSKCIEDLLGMKSLVPTWVWAHSLRLSKLILNEWYLSQNAFSTRLGPYGLDFYMIFVPDLLHEFELGVWKAVFIHLMQILYAAGGDAIQTLNERYVNLRHIISSNLFSTRYCQVPTFGWDTIWKFSNNVSSMKNLAGQDFEDLL